MASTTEISRGFTHFECTTVPGLVIIIIVYRAQQLVVNSGDTVRLPCQVDRLQVRLVRNSLVPVHFLFSQGFVMMWKKQSDILTVSDQIVDKVR